jgi:hypothetical protein
VRNKWTPVFFVGVAMLVFGFAYQQYLQSIADAYNEGYGLYGGYGGAEAPITGWVIVFIGFWIMAGHIAGSIALTKGKNYGPFFWFGALIPLVGIIFAAAMSPNGAKVGRAKCPFCAEEINEEAIFCKHCRNNIGQRI